MSIVEGDAEMLTIEHKVAGIPDTVPPDESWQLPLRTRVRWKEHAFAHRTKGLVAYETVALKQPVVDRHLYVAAALCVRCGKTGTLVGSLDHRASIEPEATT